MRRIALALTAALLLGACAAKQAPYASDAFVERVTYTHDGPPRLTLFTMINNGNGSGAHTSLMINGSQRVIFDPAGSFQHESIAERNDVVYGVTPKLADFYTRYHARATYHVKVQKLDVSPEVAERALQMVQAYGAVPQAQCSLSTSGILAELFPGQIKRTWFPNRLAEDFGQIEGVEERDLREYDSDDKKKVLRDYVPDEV